MIRTLDAIDGRDWQKVARKALVKKIVRHAETVGAPIQNITVSGAFGSVYIDIGLGAFDSDYDCWDRTMTIRVADHSRTSGEHAQPDFNIVGAGDAGRAMVALGLVAGGEY